MNKRQFEHAVRAAGAILSVNELLVMGSQAIHASVDVKIPEAERSIEVDISALEDPDGSKADLVDGSIGELSMFQDTFGYYAQGVTPETAKLPEGWRKRLVPYSSTATDNVKAWCLEPHDLWLSKAVTGGQKDMVFCGALLERGVVKPATLKRRLKRMKSIDSAVARRVEALIDKESNE